MTTVSRTVEKDETNPFQHRGVETQRVFRWFRHTDGRVYPDHTIEAYHGENFIGSASHSACLWPEVEKYLAVA